jgi:hypothetical protein
MIRNRSQSDTRKGRPVNVVKEQGTSKRRTKEIADHARRAVPRAMVEPSAIETERQRGGRREEAAHPSQRGGIKADSEQELLRSGEHGDKVSGAKREGARSRADGPREPGGRSRTGKSRAGDRSRRQARAGSRTRGG